MPLGWGVQRQDLRYKLEQWDRELDRPKNCWDQFRSGVTTGVATFTSALSPVKSFKAVANIVLGIGYGFFKGLKYTFTRPVEAVSKVFDGIEQGKELVTYGAQVAGKALIKRPVETIASLGTNLVLIRATHKLVGKALAPVVNSKFIKEGNERFPLRIEIEVCLSERNWQGTLEQATIGFTFRSIFRSIPYLNPVHAIYMIGQGLKKMVTIPQEALRRDLPQRNVQLLVEDAEQEDPEFAQRANAQLVLLREEPGNERAIAMIEGMLAR